MNACMRYLLIANAGLALAAFVPCAAPVRTDRFAFDVFDPHADRISMHWKDTSEQVIGSLGALERLLTAQGRTLVAAMNGGMYMEDRTPLGLFVEEGVVKHRLNTMKQAHGNFYLQPNGVFGITDGNDAFIVTTDAYPDRTHVRYATQSGPMLVIDGAINDGFTAGSENLNIRNGVGLRADGRVVLAISRTPVNLYDFARFFLDQDCSQALYLDGFVSRAFLPAAGVEQRDGSFGALIAVSR